MKLQSGVEYIITYSWAFLLLAIAIAVLFELGVFTPVSAGSGHCILPSGWSCVSYAMNTSGAINLSVLQTLGSQIIVTGIACYQNSSYINIDAQRALKMNSGSEQSFAAKCYTASNALYSGAIGTTYQGYISIYYVKTSDGIAESMTGSILVSPSTNSLLGFFKVSYVPITLSNQQSTGTSAGFQQMIAFNPSTYSANEVKNLSNIEFTSGAPSEQVGSTPLYAWIESNAINTASNTVVWVNLGSSVMGAAGGGSNTLTIYMNFLTGNTPVTSSYTGYAPQLWCASGCFQTTYAQYDNGADVFTNYWNFAGTTLWSGLSASPAANALVSQSNGLELGTAQINYGFTLSTNWHLTSPYIYEGLITAQNSGSSSNYQEGLYIDGGADASYVVSGGTCAQNWYISRRDIGGNFFQMLFCNTVLASSGATGSYPYTSIESFSQNTIGLSVYDDGTLLSNSITNNLQSGYAGVDLVFASSLSSNQLFVQYLRTRAYPPGGVMPSFSFGNIV